MSRGSGGYVDSLEIIDTHEHLLGPELVKNGFFLDFSLALYAKRL